MSSQIFIKFSFVKNLIDSYEKIEMASAPISYFYAVDKEQIEQRAKKSDVDSIISKERIIKNELDELASFLYMPGSDLPKLKDNEVEIARLAFDTVVGNAYSLRAEWVSDEIFYRMVTEIEYLDISVPIKSSKKPLSLAETILQFEQADPAIGLNDLAHAIQSNDEDVNLENYIRAESAFYSGFSQFYIFASNQLIKN